MPIQKINAASEEEPAEPASVPYVPNVMEESRLFEKAGVGVGEDEAYRVYKSLAVFLCPLSCWHRRRAPST